MEFLKDMFGGVSIDNILFGLGVILVTTKLVGLLMRKLKLPQVVGYLLAGLILGPAIWGEINGSGFAIVKSSSVLNVIAEVGVILIMFSAGLETDVKSLKKSGVKATVIALGGVVFPLALGFAVSIPFLGTDEWLGCLFVGTILTATSVGITVETLKELGVLKSEVGTCIVEAAIIDDVIGIVVLSIVVSLENAAESPWITLLKIVLFFIVAVGLGVLIHYCFRRLEKKHPHTRRLPILALAICFLYSWLAESVFGLADITGAYVAGLILSLNNKSESEYIDRKVEINSYTFFAPIFFANIGLKISFEGFSSSLLLFALCFVAVGIAGKIIGAGGTALCFRYSFKDSLRIGVGMISRGEVALIITEKGIAGGVLDAKYRVLVVLLILVSSLLAPILLKLLYRNEPPVLAMPDVSGATNAGSGTVIVFPSEETALPTEQSESETIECGGTEVVTQPSGAGDGTEERSNNGTAEH